jgi:HSP20 family molecular chaperone IbpA
MRPVGAGVRMDQAVRVREGEADRVAETEAVRVEETGGGTAGWRAMRLICRVAGCEKSEIHITVKTRTARMLCRRCGRFTPVARW